MFRNGGGRNMLRSYLLSQAMPEGFGSAPVDQSEITGQFGGGAGELAMAEANQGIINANTGMNKVIGNAGQALGGNPQFSGWNAGALMRQANPMPQMQQRSSPWGDLIPMLSKKYGGY